MPPDECGWKTLTTVFPPEHHDILPNPFPHPLAATTTDANSEHPHHAYLSPDADLVLMSTDGIKFRVHSLTMMMASEIAFGDMVKMGPNAKETDDDPAPAYETNDAIELAIKDQPT